MKKIVLCLVFALRGVLSVNAHAIDAKSRVITVNTEIITDTISNYIPVLRYLDLKEDQIEEFYHIHSDVYQSIGYLEKKKDNGVKYFNNHMKYDLKNSSYILDKEQYKKYLIVLNTTLANKKLTDYIN